jgi:hypothetical protein
MDRRSERTRGVSRVVRLHDDDGPFDRAFLAGGRPRGPATRYGDQAIHVIGLRHLVANKRATGRPQDLLDAEAPEGELGSR